MNTTRPATIANREILKAERLAFERIPIIDLAPALGADRAARLGTAKAIREACIGVGFFYIRNHGVVEAVMERTLAETERFFALPDAVKRKYDIAKVGYHRGYVPVGGLSADPDAVDLQEGFEVGLELPADDPDYVAGNPIYGPNVWPAELPAFQTHVYACFEEMLALGRRLFALFALALDLPEDYFEPEIDKPMAQLRLIYYPAAAERAGAENVPRNTMGIGAHTDYECFTILWQNESGLQVQNPEGRWIEAPPIPGTFVINIGDMLQRWTNDLFVSTPHRVISTTRRARYSFPFFFGANYETVVRCLETCCGPDNPPRYPPTKCGLWTETMHTYAYAYRHGDRGRLASPELTSG